MNIKPVSLRFAEIVLMIVIIFTLPSAFFAANFPPPKPTPGFRPPPFGVITGPMMRFNDMTFQVFMIKPDTYTVDEVSKCLSQIGPYPYRLATIEEVAAFKKKHGADFIPTHVRDYPDMVKGMIPVIVARVDRSYGITSEYARLIRQRNRN